MKTMMDKAVYLPTDRWSNPRPIIAPADYMMMMIMMKMIMLMMIIYDDDDDDDDVLFNR